MRPLCSPRAVRALIAAFALASLAAPFGEQPSLAHEVGDTVVSIDTDPGTAGIQDGVIIPTSGSFAVDIVAEDFGDLGAFNLEVVYDNTVLSAPTVAGASVDSNPDASQAYLNSTGRSLSCSPPSPSGDTDASATVGAAFISCYSTGIAAGPEAAHGAPRTLARLTFDILGPAGGSSLQLRNVNLFNSLGTVELASCAPTVGTPATCRNGAVTNQPGDNDGDGCTNLREYSSNPARGGQRNPNSHWDFYDTPNPNGVPQRDLAVTIADIFRVAARFGATGDETVDPLSPPPKAGYHPSYDRGGQAGANLWNQAPADGAIAVADIFAVAGQFGHSCA